MRTEVGLRKDIIMYVWDSTDQHPLPLTMCVAFICPRPLLQAALQVGWGKWLRLLVHDAGWVQLAWMCDQMAVAIVKTCWCLACDCTA